MTVLVAAALAVWVGAPRSAPGEVRMPIPAPPREGSPVRKGDPVGASGCLATACHGAPAEKTLAGEFDDLTWMCSGSSWLATDPHRVAYEALASETARRLMQRLGSATPATEDARCLACHTNPSLAGATSDPRAVSLRAEGVSCEACHGNAGGWLREHTAWTPRTDRAAAGMTPLDAIDNRAATCVGCHVGAPADTARGYPVRDMNHDMIAAGHPRLSFDYAEYTRRLPKHWRETRPTNPAREWLIGRVVHAEAACQLLADRARRADESEPRAPWPEFAEFTCSVCHHRIPKPRVGSFGALKWQTLWPVGEDRVGRKELEVLRNELRTPGRCAPRQLTQPATTTATELAALRKSLNDLSDADLVEVVRGLFARPLPNDLESDAMGQMLLGLASLERAAPQGTPGDKFDLTFERYQRRDWPGVRLSLEALIGRVKR